MTEDNRQGALWMIDAWADLAERKEEEATAAYALARERAEQIDAMTRARNLCKQQTAEASARWTNLRAWLRDEHPGVYAAIPEGM